MKSILFTGGGSAGHVTVNLALIPKFIEDGWKVDYIGSVDGIERRLIEPLEGVTYHPIATGKLRRYFDWRNAKDPFKVVKGVMQAYRLIRRLKPNVVFSKGGFVSVPVVLGARMNKTPILIHESDLTPGLANRIAMPFATGICTTFPETSQYIKAGSTEVRHVGAVIREEIRQGDAQRGRAFCDLNASKPVLLIMGGSLGARAINSAVRAALPELTRRFYIVHLCGKGGIDPSIENSSYRQYEYVQEQLPDVLAMTDIVITRAGSNSIYEFLSLQLPMLLIPLSKRQSRGDQLLNAASFKEAGYAQVLEEEQLSAETLVAEVTKLYDERHTYRYTMRRHAQQDALSSVYGWIGGIAKP
ncbi:UDP-N-acetylglucosamine-N-acetylmuramylpentapeptide N-acetylglucosamine transferase [Paenibacillus cellulosilyticus]|uniref:UDP-N-acetylglucosamine--N-acetylmuramyl-(pentapeptide) pyrophosphoryl-undecaprenol N-acetylglucosamine transferase n=1 Tax=Paenibacillus cellulosilyticus TaxID=375489 RepID=A0A2V2YLU3_9BACL|nr:undecaprenyldiphospho-muramoylpentapeptide beta-N-acetylglucosaminyltransferase [Paenibacillus cellulosilyticus]PWV95210.1 UDP-N-acetylglucosamine-N-acetylmuramylpentapeptide N-acetylglucosamine transferase [Paenibacillus cellulosilyticus]QKS46040.1 undecaprenyldiphospho-muramoylpentapeptide beta-N-acetylglucosaminyltransferase [Paenibacillus cellulosilyticus]